MMKLDVLEDSTFAAIQSQLHRQTGKQYYFVTEAGELCSPGQTLSVFKITGGSKLWCHKEHIQVFVKSGLAMICAISTTATTTVAGLKRIIADRDGLKPDQFILRTVAGKSLTADEARLRDVGISDQSNISLIPKAGIHFPSAASSADSKMVPS